MKKKTKNIIGFGILGIAIISILLYFTLFAFTPLDPYIDLEDVKNNEILTIQSQGYHLSPYCTTVSINSIGNTYRCTTTNWDFIIAPSGRSNWGNKFTVDNDNNGYYYYQLLSENSVSNSPVIITKNVYGLDLYFDLLPTTNPELQLILIGGDGYTDYIKIAAQGTSHIITMDVSSQDPHYYIVKDNGKLVKTMSIGKENKVNVAFQLVAKDSGAGGEDFSYLRINRIAYKFPQCLISSTDKLVYDDFKSRESLSQSKLKYGVSRYCLNIPPLIFKENGIESDDYGEYLVDLVNGNSIVLTDDIRIFYVVDNASGVTPCSPGQAWSNYYNKCTLYDYTLKEEGSVVENIVLPSTSFSYTYTTGAKNLILGNYDIKPSLPAFSCIDINPGEYYSPPSPKAECWKSNLDFNGMKYNVIDSQVIKINDFLSIKYNALGKYILYRDVGQDDETKYLDPGSRLTFYIDPAFMEVSSSPMPYYIKKDSKAQGKFIINNKLTIFNSFEYSVNQQNFALQELSTKTVYNDIILKSGSGEYYFSIDTTKLGKQKIEVIPNINVYNADLPVKIYSNNKIVYEFEVVEDVIQHQEVKDYNNTRVEDNEYYIVSEESQVSMTVYVLLLGALIILVIVGIIIYKNKNG